MNDIMSVSGKNEFTHSASGVNGQTSDEIGQEAQVIILRKKDQAMSAGALFGLNFLAYAIVFVLVAALVVVACFIGIKWRKSKDAKTVPESGAAEKINKA